MHGLKYFRQIVILKNALRYPITEKIIQQVSKTEDGKIEIIDHLASFTKRIYTESSSPGAAFAKFKHILVVQEGKHRQFEDCRPSAHYQLPLVSGCPGSCEYCYLHTRCSRAPYIRLNANQEEILDRAERIGKERAPETTVFEASASSDPVPAEEISGVLSRAVEFFAGKPEIRLRFVTKFNRIDSLLSVRHEGSTEARFSVNAERAAREYERGVPAVEARIQAAARMHMAGYPTGFLIAPVFIYDGWENEYGRLLEQIRERLPGADRAISFEIIAHRYTRSARESILQLFPDTTLVMDDDERIYRFGKFGYGKYVYPQPVYGKIEDFFKKKIQALFGPHSLLYII